MRAGFDVPLPQFKHTSLPNYYRFHEDGESEEQFADRMAADLEKLILSEGPETVAAFFGEPVQGGGGALTPPRTYWDKIQAVLQKYDVMLLADEVICGFGRTGNMWGTQTYNLKPDLITCAKALSASYQPISGLMISDRIYEAMVKQSETHGTFGHGFTYGGHPVACAVALETLKIYQERDIIGHIKSVSPVFLAELDKLNDHPLVGEPRGVGLIAGVELMLDKKKRVPWPAARKIGFMVQERAHERGLVLRAIGDRVAFSPPLIITEDQIVEMFRRFRGALDDVWAVVKSEVATKAA